LCWEINRLSRNPVDSGAIQWMLQQGIVQSVRTTSREYKPDDNALLLSVESGSANQFILDMKKGVKRGIDSKIAKGLAPHMAPPGYMNSKFEIRGENYIAPDPERFPLIEKAWQYMLTGAHTVPRIREMLNNEWGYSSRQMRKRGSRPLSNSSIYRVFTNPFYAGLFKYRGNMHQGKHKPMITLAEFDKVQTLLGRDGRPRPQTHEFAFSGMIRCGECNGTITGVEKKKVIKKTGEHKIFTYYYCTRRSVRGATCTQKSYTSARDVETQIEQEILSITIDPEFKDWALCVLKETHEKEVSERSDEYNKQNRLIADTMKQLDNVTSMRIREMISDVEFTRFKGELQNTLVKLTARLREIETRRTTWVDLVEQGFQFACNARDAFVNGSLQVKKEVLLTLGGNCTLKDHKLALTKHEWLIPFTHDIQAVQSQYMSVGTGVHGSAAKKKEALDLLRSQLRE
jgi:site-specific DNA recombinase